MFNHCIYRSLILIIAAVFGIKTDQLSPAASFSFQDLASDVKDGILIVAFVKTYFKLKQIILSFVFYLKLI